jgi:hypothetical protein
MRLAPGGTAAVAENLPAPSVVAIPVFERRFERVTDT